MTVLLRKGKRVCNSTCHHAKGDVCRCICGGENHGKGVPFKQLKLDLEGENNGKNRDNI